MFDNNNIKNGEDKLELQCCKFLTLHMKRYNIIWRKI